MSGEAEDVGGEVFADLGGGAGEGRGVHECEVGVVDGETFFEQVQDAVFFDESVEAFEDFALPVVGVAGFEFGEFFVLGGFEKFPEESGVEGVFGVEIGGLADLEVLGIVTGRLFGDPFGRVAGQVALNGRL